jgi:hypothetical protein
LFGLILEGKFRLEKIRGLGRDPPQPERLHRFGAHRLIPGDLGFLTLWILLVLIKNDLVGAFALIAEVSSPALGQFRARFCQLAIFLGILPVRPLLKSLGIAAIAASY